MDAVERQCGGETMEEEVYKAELSAKRAWPRLVGWVGGATALIGFFASFAGGISWLVTHHRQQAELNGTMALAAAQAKQGEYQAAVQTYGNVLKADPLYRPALDQQLNTTMLWVEDFHVTSPAGQNLADVAAAPLDQILVILDAGLTRTKGTQAADVQAHLGWAHFLNQKIAKKEYSKLALQNFHAALASDPTNVYANAMLGNWILQHEGTLSEATLHFNTAIATGKERQFVRRMHFDGLIGVDQAGARAELMRTANEIRKSGEPFEDDQKERALYYCFDPNITDDHSDFIETLSAVPPHEVWLTYQWLDDNGSQTDLVFHNFVLAKLYEMAGDRQSSLKEYRRVRVDLRNDPGTMRDLTDAAIARLSH